MERYIPERKQRKQNTNEGIFPGIYRAEVISVVSPDGFATGQAIDVTYAVSMNELTVYYKERFLIADRYSPRTQEFETFLDSIGAERYEDIIGLELELTFEYVVKKGKTWCNITNYELLSEVEDNDGNI